MKPKVLSWIFWISIALAIVAIAGLSLNNRKIFSQKSSQVLLDFPMTSVTRFAIEDFTRGLQFTQTANGAWQVSPLVTDLQKQLNTQTSIATNPVHPANREKIIAYLTELSLIKVQTPVAKNTKPETFQINPLSLHISFYDAAHELLGQLFIGKKGFEQMSTYVMKAGDSDVYWIPQDIRTQALMPLEFWLDTND